MSNSYVSVGHCLRGLLYEYQNSDNSRVENHKRRKCKNKIKKTRIDLVFLSQNSSLRNEKVLVTT